MSLTLRAPTVGVPRCLCHIGLLGQLRGSLGWEPYSHGPAPHYYTALGILVKLEMCKKKEGSLGWTRTSNPAVNSRVLCR